MNDVHDKMMEHISLAVIIDEKLATGALAEERRVHGLYQWQIDLEGFLYGALNGMAYNNSATCASGLKAGINYAFQMMQFSEVYLPWNTLKFSVAMNKLSDAGNTVYA